MQASNRRAVLAALCANLGIAIAKFVGYAITGASSMLAESVHSVADTSNQALLLWGGAAAARDPTRRHPFGYGRERYFWSFVVALVLFSLGAVFALWEMSTPRRRLTARKSVRWFSNLALVTMNTLLVPLLVPIAAMGMAKLAQEQGWGLLNFYSVPYLVAFVFTILALDFVIYLQHVMFHSVPILWRLHRVHHSDVDLDVSSGTRFHIIEILISMGIKVAAITLIGPPVLAVLAFEVLLNGTAMFNHANIRLPDRVDRLLRMVLVTPDMHRVHHSVVRKEMDANFGFNLPWWDHLCGTYRAQPEAGHEGMTIGVEQFRSEEDQYLHHLLIQPFIREEAREQATVSQIKYSAQERS